MNSSSKLEPTSQNGNQGIFGDTWIPLPLAVRADPSHHIHHTHSNLHLLFRFQSTPPHIRPPNSALKIAQLKPNGSRRKEGTCNIAMSVTLPDSVPRRRTNPKVRPMDRERLRLSNRVLLLARKLEKVIRIGRKGVTTIPKSIRQEAGIVEGSELRAKALPYGILLRPLIMDPIETLGNLPTKRKKKSSVETVRRLRERIDREVRVKQR